MEIKKRVVQSFFASFMVFSAYAIAQEAAEPVQDEDGEEKVKKVEQVLPKPMTKAEKKVICRGYEGRYIAYYSEVYKVSKCKRKKLSSKDVYHLTQKGKPILQVGQKVIDALTEVEEGVLELSPLSAAACRRIENQYIVSLYGEVLYIDNCKKRKFTFWKDYKFHQKKFGSKKKIIPISEEEYFSLVDGEPMPESESKMNVMEETVDIIPLDEACEGIEGRFVSYYSKIYKIEKCRKRIVDLAWFQHKKIAQNTRLREMTSEQWISIPNGVPIVWKKTKKNKNK